MERLTERFKGGCIAIKGRNTAYKYAEHKSAPAAGAIERLAAYEDTGLEPEEIKVILERYHAFRSAISDEAGQPMVSWTRAGEICRAEKDGRLVVLPECVPGDPPLKRREMRTEGATSYCPKNCPNKDCVGGQCLVNHGTKPRRR